MRMHRPLLYIWCLCVIIACILVMPEYQTKGWYLISGKHAPNMAMKRIYSAGDEKRSPPIVTKMCMSDLSMDNLLMYSVHDEKQGTHRLYQCNPMAIGTSNTRLVHRSKRPIYWCLSSDGHFYAYIHRNTMVLYRYDSNRHHRTRSTIELGMSSRCTDREKWMAVHDSDRAVIVGCSPYLFYVNVELCKLYPIVPDEVGRDWMLCPKAVAGSWMLLSYPMHKETDGMVEAYRLSKPEPDDEGVEHVEATCVTQWTCEDRGSLFGNEVVAMASGRVAVAAQFAPAPLHGAGAVFIYQLHKDGRAPTKIQKISCPDSVSNTNMGVLNFGTVVSASRCRDWLAITALNGSYSLIYRYHWQERIKRYVKIHTIHSSGMDLRYIGKCTDIDSRGNLAMNTRHEVYYASFGFVKVAAD